MPCRAAISLLILLTGTGGATAATLDSGVRNRQFQPGNTKHFAIMRPAQARILGGEAKYAGVKVQKITPILPASTRVELGRSSLQTPADAAVRPPATKAGGH